MAAEQRAQHHHMNGRPEQRDDEAGDHERDPKVSRGSQCNHAQVGAQHEQLAVGEVDHVHDAEDQREAGGHQRQDHACDDAVNRLDQELVEGNRLKKLLEGHATLRDTGA
jgi:hypothetical protein